MYSCDDKAELSAAITLKFMSQYFLLLLMMKTDVLLNI